VENIKFKAYAIVSESGIIDYNSIRLYKGKCISDFSINYTMKWEDIKKYGWRCKSVYVQVSEIK